MPCEHILSIMGNSHPMMHHIRWWNSFQLHHMRDEKLTQEFNKFLMKEYEGVSVEGLSIRHKHGEFIY